MKKKKNNKFLISRIKNSVSRLNAKSQLPHYLCYLIFNITENDNEEYIKNLMEFTELYLRCPYFYSKYKRFDLEYENEIKEFFKKGENN